MNTLAWGQKMELYESLKFLNERQDADFVEDEQRVIIGAVVDPKSGAEYVMLEPTFYSLYTAEVMANRSTHPLTEAMMRVYIFSDIVYKDGAQVSIYDILHLPLRIVIKLDDIFKKHLNEPLNK